MRRLEKVLCVYTSRYGAFRATILTPANTTTTTTTVHQLRRVLEVAVILVHDTIRKRQPLAGHAVIHVRYRLHGIQEGQLQDVVCQWLGATSGATLVLGRILLFRTAILTGMKWLSVSVNRTS